MMIRRNVLKGAAVVAALGRHWRLLGEWAARAGGKLLWRLPVLRGQGLLRSGSTLVDDGPGVAREAVLH